MLYESIKLKRPLSIKRIYTIHYYEYDCQYHFEGESHDFWEFIYVDLGTALIRREGSEMMLRQGMGLLHAPGVHHTLSAEGSSGLNLFVISFDCTALQLHKLSLASIPIFEADKALLSSILGEARESFSSTLDSSYFKLRRRDQVPFAGEQLIALYLESLLINMLRRLELPRALFENASLSNNSADEEQLALVIACMQNNLQKPLSVDELCHGCHLSRSKLQRLFQQYTKQSAMGYYISLRIEAAKTMMRDHQHSFSDIADTMGFSSIHYFSKQFKQITGMSPSQYSASLRSLSEKKSC